MPAAPSCSFGQATTSPNPATTSSERDNGRPFKLKRAFTLVELLVVIAIIGILVGIVLPGVNAARESARNTRCESRIRQLGLAAITYENTNQVFPPGYLGPTPHAPSMNGDVLIDVHNQYVGALFFLLPFFEQQNIYDSVQVPADKWKLDREPHKEMWIYTPTLWDAAHNPIEEVRCPSAEGSPTEGVIQHTNLFAEGLFGRIDGSRRPIFMGAPLGITNYVGTAGEWGTALVDEVHKRGIFFNRSTTQTAHIKDGLSKTFLFGETTGETEGANMKKVHAWMGVGVLPLHWGITEKAWTNFSSNHPGGVNFCYADGHVGTVQTETPKALLYLYGGVDDGLPPED